MLKKSVVAMFAVLVVYSYAKANEVKVDFDGKANYNFDLTETLKAVSFETPSIQEAAVPQTENKGKTGKEWTIMVFINNKNNLWRYGLKDFNEMEMVGSSDKINVVVELGAGADSSSYSYNGTRRYYVTKDSDPGSISSQMVQDLGKVDMGDYTHLVDFAKWAKTNYPAKKYTLIVWNHGAGWIKSSGQLKGISYDDETGNHINTPQLGAAMQGIGKIDILGTDACLMGMAEVAYEVKDYVTYIVGSEETEPGDGYTYNDMLYPLAAKPAMAPAEFAKTMVSAYTAHYQSTGDDVTQAYVKSSAMPGFVAAVNAFTAAVMDSGEKALVKQAMRQAQSYAYDENKDLYHFTQLLVASSKNAAVKERGQALMKYIKGNLVGYNAVTSSYSNSHGIAVYLPDYGMGAGYGDLQWAKASTWDEFINWYQKN